MTEAYKVISSQPWVYQNEGGSLVHGFKIILALTEFNENHEILVPKMEPTLVKSKADEILKNRKALSSL